MELIQIFNRTTGQWSERYHLEAGYSESWKLDKSTDSARDIKFTVLGVPEPPFKVIDWVRILHIENETDVATYDASGLPTNSTQYVIAGVQSIFNSLIDRWRVSMTLKEPIERTNGVIGETLTYTNQTQKDYTVGETTTTYYKALYNHYTALERWLKVTPANCDSYAAGYNKDNNVSWFNRIKILDETWLETLSFADTTLNELSLYNLLMDNYDSSTGKTPVMYFDINPATDLPYNLTRDEYILKFERQDGFDKTVLDYDILVTNTKDLTLTKEWDNYATGLITNAENISASSVIEYPAQSLYAVPEVNADKRVTTTYTTGGDNWVIRFPQNIKRITKLSKLSITGKYTETEGGGRATATLIRANTAIATNNVYEKKQYLALEIDPTEDNTVFWYEEGENLLHIKEYSYVADGMTAMYYIEYIPLPSCCLMVGNNEYVQQINQSSSQIDAQKYAAFMNNYLKGMNKADIIFEKHYTEYSDFENHIGSVVKSANKTFMITQVGYKNRGYTYDAVYQLNENHFRKSMNYTASQQIRTNTAIATNNIKDRKTAIKQVVNLGLTSQAQEGNQFLVNKMIVLSALIPQVVDSKYYPQTALFEGNSKLYTNSALTTSVDFPIIRLANIAKFQFGNQVNLNVKYFDNADAGKSKIAGVGNITDTVPPYRMVFGFLDVKSQTPTLYTDPFGEVQTADIYLTSIDNGALTDCNYPGAAYNGELESEFERTEYVYNTMANLPNVYSDRISGLISNACAFVDNQVLLKHQLEAFNENIIIEVNSDDMIICKDLLGLSRLLNQSDTHTSLSIKFFTVNKSENDDITTGLHSQRTVTAITEGVGYYRFAIAIEVLTGATSLIVLTNNLDKLLIINNLSDTIKANIITNNYLDIYYA